MNNLDTSRRAALIEAKEALDNRENRIAQAKIGLAAMEPSMTGLLNSQGQLVSEFLTLQGAWAGDCPSHKFATLQTAVAKAYEADREDRRPSDHIAGFSYLEEKVADALILLLDVAGKRNLRLSDAFHAKMRYNFTRPPSVNRID